MKHFLIIAFAFSLTACQTMEGLKQDFSNLNLERFQPASSTGENSQFLIDGDCPQIEIAEELSTLNNFTNAQSPNEADLISAVKMTTSNSTCTYGERTVTVDLKLDLNGTLGPQGSTTAYDYPFFVAVTSAGKKILAKESFTANIAYPPGQQSQTYTETLRQIIPADSRAIGSSYKIVAGFQLTQDQLAHNRATIAAEIAAEQARLKAEEAAAKAAEKLAKEAPIEDLAEELPDPPPIETIQIEQIPATPPKTAGPIDLVNP